MYPSTSNGKLFCIFYALTAIPIFGFVNFRISSFIKIKYLQAEHKIFGEHPKKYQHNLSFTLYVFLGVTSLFLLPAYGFSFLEGWKYMDSIYFTVISLTTVGFGDYSPSFEGSEETGVKFMGVYRVLVLFWMLIGLAWLGSLLSLTSDKFGTILTTAFQKALNTDLSVPDFDYEPEKNRHLSNDDDSNECLMVPHDSGYFLHPTPHLHTVCRPIREDEPVVKWDTQKWEDF